MPRPPRHREAIVSAAVTLFRRHGYAGTGLREILERSGAPRGSLYHFFPGGKEELGAAAVERACAVVRATLEELAASTDGPQEFVARYCEMLAAWLEASGYRDGCPIATTVLETVPSSERIGDAARRGLDGWLSVIAGVFAADGADGPAARRRATALVASVEGALFLARLQRSASPFEAVVAEFVERSHGDD